MNRICWVLLENNGKFIDIYSTKNEAVDMKYYYGEYIVKAEITYNKKEK